jgi:hypothetical protein
MDALLNLAFGQPLQQGLGLVTKIAVIKNAAHWIDSVMIMGVIGILTYMQVYIVSILTHFIVILYFLICANVISSHHFIASYSLLLGVT